MAAADGNVKVREVAAGVFVVPLPLPMRPRIVNVHLIRSQGEWALVDFGLNSTDSLATLRAAMESVGCTPGDIDKLICTHHHPDHFGAARTVRDLTGAPLYIHDAEYERSHIFMRHERPDWVRRFFDVIGMPVDRLRHVPSPGEFWASMYRPVPPDVSLHDGDVIRVGDIEIEIVWTPGHAPGHCVLYLRKERLMISGDHLLPRITPHVGLFPGGKGNPLADFLASQVKIQDYDVDLVLPAHGGVFPDHRRRARQIIQHHEARLREIADLVRRHPRMPYEVARLAFGIDEDSPVMVQFPATFETLAHLEYLRQDGQIGREERNGKVYYEAV